MAKEMKTRKELTNLVMREARARQVPRSSEFVCHRTSQPRALELDIGTSSDGPNLVSGPCRIKLNVIVGPLQATYDLSGD